MVEDSALLLGWGLVARAILLFGGDYEAEQLIFDIAVECVGVGPGKENQVQGHLARFVRVNEECVVAQDAVSRLHYVSAAAKLEELSLNHDFGVDWH